MRFYIRKGFFTGILTAQLLLALAGCDAKDDKPVGSGTAVKNADFSSLPPCQQYLSILEACLVEVGQNVDQQKLQSAKESLLFKISQADADQHEEVCKKSLLSIDEHKKALGCRVP